MNEYKTTFQQVAAVTVLALITMGVATAWFIYDQDRKKQR